MKVYESVRREIAFPWMYYIEYQKDLSEKSKFVSIISRHNYFSLLFIMNSTISNYHFTKKIINKWLKREGWLELLKPNDLDLLLASQTLLVCVVSSEILDCNDWTISTYMYQQIITNGLIA